MRDKDVPQENAKAFMGHSKLLYAEDASGHYQPAPCNGWKAEEIVLDQAIEEFQRLAVEAWHNCHDLGKTNAIEYHMYHERMDIPLLAQSTGFTRWRVRRDLHKDYFKRLPLVRRKRYADALGKTVRELGILPLQP